METNANLLMTAVFMAASLSSFSQPSFTVQPADQTVSQGFSANFSAVAQGTAPLNYEWFFQSNAIPSATTNVLAITNAQPTNAGSYFLVVTNSTGSATSRVATLTVILPVPLDPKLSANIRLGDDPPELSTNQRAQIEPHIARSYVDPNLLLATFQEGVGSPNPVGIGAGYSVSTNGGLTWTRALIPGLTTLSGGQYPLTADNVAAIDLQGNLFVTSLVGSNTPNGLLTALMINKAVDPSKELGQPQVVVPGSSTHPADKEWIAINTFPGSLTAGRLAVAFTREDGTNHIHSIYSDDGGGTWSQPRPIGSRDATGAQTFFLPDGTLGILYYRFLNGYLVNGGDPGLIELVLSADGGETFGLPILVKDMTGITFKDPIAFAWSVGPAACADRQAGAIYAALQAQTGSGTNRAPRILFTKSIDQGTTWSTAVPVNDTPARKSVFNPAIAVSPDGQHVTICFYDKRHQTATSAENLADYYLAESFDGGDTWEPNIRLSDFSSDLRKAPFRGGSRLFGDYQGIVPALNFQTPGVAVWIDTRSGNNDPYVVRITRTKGTTFETWRKLRFSTNDLANPTLSGESGDLDGDRIPNLAEYAFGLEPSRADASPLNITRGTGDASATVSIAYERLAVLGDIQFSWQTSDNLVEWIPVSPAQESIVLDRDPSMQRVVASLLVGDRMRFFRLGVSRMEPAP